MPSVGENIKRLRLKLNMTQSDLAEKIGMTNRTISNWERNYRDPGSQNVQLLCSILGCTVDEIIQNEDPFNPYCNPIRKSSSVNVYDRFPFNTPVDKVDIPINLATTGEYFGFLIHNDSMAPRILANDIVIVKKQDHAENGEIVIANIDGDETVCRTLMDINGNHALISTNQSQEYPPIIFTDNDLHVQIFGKVVESRRRF